MARYAAFLRGINLGRRRVTGDQLCAPFLACGLHDVASFLASGNVVFTTNDDAGTAELTLRIEAQLETSLGFSVTTFLRSDRHVHELVDRNPFTGDLAAATGKPQVILLRSVPTSDVAHALLQHATVDDRLVLDRDVLHWLPATGVSTSNLNIDAITKPVGPTTMRTANTIARLHAKFFADA